MGINLIEFEIILMPKTKCNLINILKNQKMFNI